LNDQDRAIVIGGGIAGVSSALSLADNGYSVYVIEKNNDIGGHAVSFCCKATDQCNSCGVCLAKDKIRQAVLQPNIHFLTHSEVVSLKEDESAFEVEVQKRPLQTEAGCKGYEKNCGAGCFDQAKELISLRASALVVATGFEAYDAGKKGHLSYGRFPEVITGLDLEQKLSGGGNIFASAPESKPRVAFIQCVGSRDPHIGQDYCSRVCCKYATRMAARLKSQHEVDVTIFYIDLQKDRQRDWLLHPKTSSVQ